MHLPLIAAAVDIDAVVRQYEEYLQLTAQVDALRAKRNDNSKAMKGKLDQEVTRAVAQRMGLCKRLLGAGEKLFEEPVAPADPEQVD